MRIPTLKKETKLLLAIIFAVALALFPAHPAKACILSSNPISSCILEGTSYIVYLIFTIVGKGIVALTGILQWIINIPVYPDKGIAVIDESWKIMRNFANMLFIVALIVMAFATIFDVLPGAAQYNARSLFGRFLFTALLINFSLILGVMVIQGTQILSNTFLTAIGDVSGKLGQGLNPSNLLLNTSTTTASKTVDQGVFGALISLVFATVLAITFLFSVLTALIFALVRIPILWALLVVSPLAWILNVFPAGQDTFKKWWSTFIGWNMFLPIFLFFLYFGLYFLQSQGAIMAAIASQTRNQSLGAGVPFNLQQLFFYVLAGIFLIGGTIVAMKASMFSGTGVTQVAGWARGRAARWTGLTGANQAFQEKRKEIEGGEGRLGRIFGGPPPGQATFRSALGVRGLKTEREFISSMDKELANLKEQETSGKIKVDNEFKLKAYKTDANSAQGASMRALLHERGMIDAAGFGNDMKKWIDKNPLLAEKMVDLAQKGGFKNVSATQILDMASATGTYSYLNTVAGVNTRKKLFNSLTGDKDIPGLDMALGKMDASQLKIAIDLNGGDKTMDSDKFKKAVGKKRADIVAQHNSTIEGTPVEYEMWKLIRDKDVKDVADMLPPTWKDATFQDALKRKMILLDKYNPEIPGPGTYFPRGSRIPAGVGAGTPLGGGTFFAGARVPGGKYYNKKTHAGGGEMFRSSLLRQTTKSPKKNRIVVSL